MAELSLADRLAAIQAKNKETAGAEANKAAQVANAAEAAAAINAAPGEPEERVFYGELPPAVSYLTATGKPVFFYQGYHKTSDADVIEYCKTIADVQDITGQIRPEDVPVPELRTRARNWASAERTTITPAELLGRAAAFRVQSTADTPQAATSNSTV